VEEHLEVFYHVGFFYCHRRKPTQWNASECSATFAFLCPPEATGTRAEQDEMSPVCEAELRDVGHDFDCDFDSGSRIGLARCEERGSGC
jgi:hypothetical protein